MKKRIYLLLLSVVVIFISCKDKTGMYAEQLFTNKQISGALQECLKLAVDSTCTTLCVVDTLNEKYGYYYFDSKTYRITLPPAAKNVIDTLTRYGFEASIDTLVLNMNRAAEQCGSKMKSQFWKPIVDSITFPNPNLILHGKNSPITDYVRETKQSEFTALASGLLAEQLNTLNVIKRWDELQKEYFEITGIYSPIDICNPAMQQMTAGFFKKMAIVEVAIRKYPELRGNKNGLLYKVFETL